MQNYYYFVVFDWKIEKVSVNGLRQSCVKKMFIKFMPEVSNDSFFRYSYALMKFSL